MKQVFQIYIIRGNLNDLKLSNSSFEKANPSDCENCYIFTLSDDGKITGRTSTNTIFGEFQIENRTLK